MIQIVCNMLADQLNTYIRELEADLDADPVVIGNIGMAEGLGGQEGILTGKVVLSLANIMEETTLKNTSPYVRYNDRHELENPPVFLNLYLLFSSHFPQSSSSKDNEYIKALTRLSRVIEYLQSKTTFTVRNSQLPDTLYNSEHQDIKVNLELFSLTFEQLNHLWGSLGGKQVPFVMYKAGILPLKREYTTARGAYIENIETNTDHIRQE